MSNTSGSRVSIHSGTLTSLFSQPGVSLSVRNLFELMLLINDNSATDIVLRLAGRPESVTAKTRELGIAGINVNRPTVNLIADWLARSFHQSTIGLSYHVRQAARRGDAGTTQGSE